MLGEDRRRRIGVAIDRGFEQPPVLAAGVAALVRDDEAEPAIALALLVEAGAEAQQPLQAAGRDQRRMEAAVRGRPRVVMDLVVAGLRVGRGLEIGPRLFDRGLPRSVA